MSTEYRDTDQTALAARLGRGWQSFKQGQLIGYRLMALILIVIAVIGSSWYILHERHKTNSQQWMQLAEANSQSSLEELTKANPNSLQERLARFQIARDELSVSGIDQLSSTSLEKRKTAIDNIVKARDELGKLAGEFNDQTILKAECLLGLAKAEAALIAVPASEGQMTEFKGSLPKVVEYLDQFLAVAAPGTAWATEAKKLAEELRDPNSSTAHEFTQVARTLYSNPIGVPPIPGHSPLMPGMPGDFPGLSGGGLPGMPGGMGGFPGGSPVIPGVPLDPGAGGAQVPKIEPIPTPTPGGATPPVAPGGATPSGTPAPGKTSEPPAPIAPPAKGPDKAPSGTAPAPKAAESPAPIAPPPKK